MPQRVLARGDGALEHADLRVERADVVVSAGDVGGDAEERVIEVRQRGLGRGVRGLAVAPDAPEEIEFPIQIDGKVENIVSAREGCVSRISG